MDTLGKRWDWRRKSNLCVPRVFVARQREQRSERFRGVTTSPAEPKLQSSHDFSDSRCKDADAKTSLQAIRKRLRKAEHLHLLAPLLVPRVGVDLPLLALLALQLPQERSTRVPQAGSHSTSVRSAKEGEENEGTDCMKLQNPPRSHWPRSFWRQQASRKSVTGESSAYNGRPAEDVRRRIRKLLLIRRREDCQRTGIPALVQLVDRTLRLVLPVEPCVDIADEVVADVVANVHLEHVAVLDELAVDVFVCIAPRRRSAVSGKRRGGERKANLQNLSKNCCVSSSERLLFGLGSRGGASFGRKCGFDVEPWICAGFCRQPCEVSPGSRRSGGKAGERTWYMLRMTIVCEYCGLMCLREQRSPWRHAPILR